ncbi:unnamed protein product [Absidia cylindrospora]
MVDIIKKATQEHRHLYTYFQAIYRFYLQRGLALRNRFNSTPSRLPEKPRVKFNDLQLIFTWWISMKVNVMIKRNSRLPMETNSVPPLTVYMFQMMDGCGSALNNGSSRRTGHQRRKYRRNEAATDLPVDSPVLYSSTSSTSTAGLHYSTSQPFLYSTSAPVKSYIHHNYFDRQISSDPLQSLPPEQAIHLIHDFFLVHPHSILVNKAKLMIEYWSDTANPLLLSVIYGTTLCFSQILQGRPMSLWESDNEINRNPFLTYAYSLLKNLPTLPSVSDYQAIAMLAFFEIFWGYSKLGMSLLATSYLMGSQLGLWDKTFKASNHIEAELVNMTFWAVYRVTTVGAIEIGASIDDSLVCRDHLFPPMNIYESCSYQSDLLHNNINDASRHSYMIESFYSGAVVTHYSGFLHACLPKPYINIYGLKTNIPTSNDSQALSQLRAISDVETRIHKVLDDFNAFIQQQRHKWTVIQRYTIETTYRLYRIHFRFLQPSLTSGPRKYQEELIPTAAKGRGVCSKILMDPTNPDIANRLRQVRSDILAMVDDLEEILTFGSNNNHDTNYPKPMNETSLLPHDIMASAFETSARLLMLSCQMDPSKHMHDAICKLLAISHLQDAHQPPSTATKNLRDRLKIFLKRHPLVSETDRQQQLHSNGDIDYIHSSLEPNSQGLFYLHPPNVTQQQYQFTHCYHHDQLQSMPATSTTFLNHPSSGVSNTSPPVNTFMMNTTAPSTECGITDLQNGGNQLGHHQPVGLDESVFIDWYSMMTQTLHPYGLTAFLEQDQEYLGHIPK